VHLLLIVHLLHLLLIGVHLLVITHLYLCLLLLGDG
jgi:hypothetical protein